MIAVSSDGKMVNLCVCIPSPTLSGIAYFFRARKSPPLKSEGACAPMQMRGALQQQSAQESCQSWVAMLLSKGNATTRKRKKCCQENEQELTRTPSTTLNRTSTKRREKRPQDHSHTKTRVVRRFFLSLHICSRSQRLKRKCWWHWAIVAMIPWHRLIFKRVYSSVDSYRSCQIRSPFSLHSRNRLMLTKPVETGFYDVTFRVLTLSPFWYTQVEEIYNHTYTIWTMVTVSLSCK